MVSNNLENALDKFIASADWNLQLLPDEATELRKALIQKLRPKSSGYVKLTTEEKEQRRADRQAARGSKSTVYTKLDPEEKEQRQLLRLIAKKGKAGASLGKIESWAKHGHNSSLRFQMFNDLRAPTSGKIVQRNDAVGRSFFYTQETWKEAQDALSNT